MAKVRKYRLSDTSQDVDLCQYEDEIVQTINDTVPGKHPKVYPDYFTTDPLSQSEAVKIGRALSKRNRKSRNQLKQKAGGCGNDSEKAKAAICDGFRDTSGISADQ